MAADHLGSGRRPRFGCGTGPCGPLFRRLVAPGLLRWACAAANRVVVRRPGRAAYKEYRDDHERIDRNERDGLARLPNQVRLIAIDEVCYFQANDTYTSVFTTEAESLIRTWLRDLAEQLDRDRFWQIHRGPIVNGAHVTATTRDVSRRVSVKLKSRQETLAVSRAFAHRFRQR